MLEQFNKEQREEYKKKWNKSGNAGFFNELTEQINSEKVWQWIKQNNKALLKAERARVNGVIDGVLDKSLIMNMWEHGMVLLGHKKATRKMMMKRGKEKFLKEIKQALTKKV